MTIAEVRALLAKYAADNFHPPDLGDESDYLPTPRIEFRVSAAGGTLWLCDWPGGQSDLCYPVPDDSQLAAILDGSADVEWLNAPTADLPSLVTPPAAK